LASGAMSSSLIIYAMILSLSIVYDALLSLDRSILEPVDTEHIKLVDIVNSMFYLNENAFTPEMSNLINNLTPEVLYILKELVEEHLHNDIYNYTMFDLGYLLDVIQNNNNRTFEKTNANGQISTLSSQLWRNANFQSQVPKENVKHYDGVGFEKNDNGYSIIGAKGGKTRKPKSTKGGKAQPTRKSSTKTKTPQKGKTVRKSA
jgi:hypothetical protein